MPELPEVERAARLLKSNAAGKTITRVETNEDTIVFAGASHQEFANEITGRIVTNVARYGKVFYMQLDGEGRMPVLHFGMTGNIHIKDQAPLYYREGPRKGSSDWPPRFMKFIIHLSGTESPHETDTQIAFMDARRLARIRLCQSPLKDLPISALGFDPILSMPTVEEFSVSVLKRKCPVKALLLDQSFSAGVGNWVADEILYHARVHPEQKCHTLTKEQVSALHRQTAEVCRVAVEVNADDSKFPDNWLFKHRWGKGKQAKGKERAVLLLPSGEPATIKWLTVGGRTSAFVAELQHLTSGTVKGKKSKKKDEEPTTEDESDLTSLEDVEEVEVAFTPSNLPAKRGRSSKPIKSSETLQNKRRKVADGR